MSYVLYGSQTGQAKSIAENIHEILNKNINQFQICELDEIEKSYFLDNVNIAIIICSTTGDGDPPENASRFLRKIKSYSFNFLSSLRYTVLGLGDTNYSNFCYCGKTIDGILNKIGGKRFYNSNWADDAVGLEIVIEPWLEGLYQIMKVVSCDELIISMDKMIIVEKDYDNAGVTNANTIELLGEKEAAEILDMRLTVPLPPIPFLQIEYQKDNSFSANEAVVSTALLPADKSGLRNAQVSSIARITAKYAVKTVHKVTLSINDCDWNWSPGDSVGILPCNPKVEVDEILSRVGLSSTESHCPISFVLLSDTGKKNAKIPMHLVLPPNVQISVHSVLSWLCDIRSPLSKTGLRIMAQYCPTDSAEQRRLLQLCSKEGQKMYSKCMRESSMPLLDLLNWFPSCKIPIERLLEVLPRLKPRAYSLCDCDSLTFAFSKVDIAPVQAYRKRPLTGVCTTWMESLMTRSNDVTVPVYLRKSLNGFTVTNPQDPHILIGPGTGVAPFIGFLQYFEKLKQGGESIGPVWLFFGCRHEERDFIFRAELEHYRRVGVLSHLCVCFSRDGDEAGVSREWMCRHGGCRYVQECFVHHSQELTTLVVDQGARVFVCGDAAGLAKDVLAAWPAVLLAGGHNSIQSRKEADGLVARMRINKMYLEDVWT